MSTGEQMDGISHIRTIQCRTHFQSGMVHKVSFKYFSVMLGGMLHTSHDSMEEIPLIWRLNRPVQTINIFVIIVTTLNAVQKVRGIHGNHYKQLVIYKILPLVFLYRLVCPNVCLNPSCFPFSFRFFLSHCGCCLWEEGRSHLSEQPQWFPFPKSAIFPSPLPCLKGYPLPSFTLTVKEKGLNNLPSL